MNNSRKIHVEKSRLETIINKILQAPSLDSYPKILSLEKVAYSLLTNRYFLLAITDRAGISRIEKFMEEGNHPFPTLIAPDFVSVSYGFDLGNSRNTFYKNTKVKNKFSFNLGENATAIIHNHEVSINTEVFGSFEYDVELLYLISFGREITKENFYKYLDELIEFSLVYWGS